MKKIKIKCIILSVLAGFFLKTIQQELQIRYSGVYMIRNPYRVSDATLECLLEGDQDDRILAYTIMERTLNKKGVSDAEYDFGSEEDQLRKAAKIYLEKIQKHTSAKYEVSDP